MSEPTSSPQRRGPGIFGPGITIFALASFCTVLFGALKLAGVWSINWLTVFAPLIAYFGVIAFFIVLVLIIVTLAGVVLATAKALEREGR